MTPLEKAEAALERARELQVEHGPELPGPIREDFVALLNIATVQAMIAQAAESVRTRVQLTRIADSLEAREEART